MAFTVRSFAAQQTNSARLTLDLAYPATIVAGDLLLAAVSHTGSAVVTVPTGWTLVHETTGIGKTATLTRLLVYTQIATGAESGTVAFTSTDLEIKNGFMFSIAGGATAIGLTAYIQGVDQNDLTVTPSWSGDTIYLAQWDVTFSFEWSVMDGVQDRLGQIQETQLKMIAGYDPGGAAATVDHYWDLSGMSALALQLVIAAAPPPTINPENVYTTRRNGGRFICRPRKC